MGQIAGTSRTSNTAGQSGIFSGPAMDGASASGAVCTGSSPVRGASNHGEYTKLTGLSSYGRVGQVPCASGRPPLRMDKMSTSPPARTRHQGPSSLVDRGFVHQSWPTQC